MAGSLPLIGATPPRKRLDGVRPTMAKAVKKMDATDMREAVGLVIRRCFQLAGLTQKEAAALIGRDEAQLARWIAATERPHFDAIWGVVSLRKYLVTAFVELIGAAADVTLETVIRVGRKAG